MLPPVVAEEESDAVAEARSLHSLCCLCQLLLADGDAGPSGWRTVRGDHLENFIVVTLAVRGIRRVPFIW